MSTSGARNYVGSLFTWHVSGIMAVIALARGEIVAAAIFWTIWRWECRQYDLVVKPGS